MAAAACLVVAGCAMERHRADVRQGLLSVGLHRQAFLDEWGPPAQTYAVPGGTRVDVNEFAGTSTSTPVMYDVWAYPSRRTCLVFYRQRLQSWTTGTADCDPSRNPDEIPPPPTPPDGAPGPAPR